VEQRSAGRGGGSACFAVGQRVRVPRRRWSNALATCPSPRSTV